MNQSTAIITGYLQFNLHGFFSLCAGALCLVLGMIVWIKDKTSPINRSFLFFTFSAAVWIASFGMMSLLKNPLKDAHLWIAVSYLTGIPFVPYFTYIFSTRLYPDSKQKLFQKIGLVWAALTSLTMISFVKTITDIRIFRWGNFPYWRDTPMGTIQKYLLLVPFFFFTLRAINNFYRYWKTSKSPYEKIQARNIFFGFLIGYLGSADFFTALGYDWYPFGYLSLTLFISIVTYTIIRHQAFNIKFVLKRISLIVVIYLFLFLLALPAAIPILNNLLKSSSHDPTMVVLAVGTVIGLIFSAGPFIYAALVRKSYWLRGHMAAGLTHELKSPLSTIQGAAELLEDNLLSATSDKLKSAEYLAMIKNNATRLEEFVRDLLTVAKEKDERVILNKGSFDLTREIETVIDQFQPLASNKNLKLTFSNGTALPLTGDKEKIRQVFSNLLSNAVRFSDSGTVSIHADRQGDSILCSVVDEGKGIEKKDLPRVFDKFFQAHPGSKGTGLGLTIAKAWVEAHGGKIWVESKGIGTGSRFFFTIPLNS